jgi:HAD superfamily hydrolase (TIGR01509 family)
MYKNLKAVIFDIDGTLYDRNKAQKELVKGFVTELKEIFIGLDDNEIEKAFLESDDYAISMFEAGGSVKEVRGERSRRILDSLGLDRKYQNKLTEIYLSLYPDISTPTDSAADVVEKLHGKFRLGVISNGFMDMQYSKLSAIKLKHYFQIIILSENFGIRKPDSRIFHEASSQLDCQPRECLYIGDSFLNDIIGARNAGMYACWYNPGSLAIPESDIIPDIEIKSLDEIIAILP